VCRRRTAGRQESWIKLKCKKSETFPIVAQARRHRRIFLHYLRNGRGTTAIGAYLTRAREGIPIAAPVTWTAIEAGIRPDAFTMKNPFRARSEHGKKVDRKWR
jgi:bifunctional non-homologous end joining protein LigD